MSSLRPRVVLVTRQTEHAALMARHATQGQVAFYLSSRGQSYDAVAARDAEQAHALTAALAAVPADWAHVHVERGDLNRFLFFPNDIVVALGQDGLVANLAKYLDGQPVIGVTAIAAVAEGVLTPHQVGDLPALLRRTAAGDVDRSLRTMVQAAVQGGDRLLALNELFIGHRSHQSARYELQFDGAQEFQSSSGVIVATGTGMTGWAKSIMSATHDDYAIGPTDAAAAFFAREPWPSRQSGSAMRSGQISPDAALQIRSRINEGGVIFADGIEPDFIAFDWGTDVVISVAEQRLQLVR
jgi:NAD kinase